METKNVILAISLSALVIILYSLFFAPPPPDISDKKNILENAKENSDISSPSIDKEVDNNNLSRNDALNSNESIKIENENIFGSISLKGAIVDDIVFKKYTTELLAVRKKYRAILKPSIFTYIYDIKIFTYTILKFLHIRY